MAIYQLHMRSQVKLEVQAHYLQTSVNSSNSIRESNDDATPGTSAVLLQRKNKCSCSAKPYLSPIHLADDNDTAAPLKSEERLSPVCVCTYTLAIGRIISGKPPLLVLDIISPGFYFLGGLVRNSFYNYIMASLFKIHKIMRQK